MLTKAMHFWLAVLDIVVRTRTKVVNHHCIPDRFPHTKLDEESDEQGREKNKASGAPKRCN
jgi:hypothetical protein